MWRYWYLVAACLLLVRQAAAEIASLAEVTPGDAGIYVSIEGLAPAIDAYLAGPHAERLRDYPPVAQWVDKHRPTVLRFIDDAARQIGVDPRTAWNDVLGNRLMLAAWPAEPGQPEGHGLLIVEARQREALQRLIEGVHDAQSRAGEVVRAERRTHAGSHYHARVLQRRGGQSEVFLSTSGRIAVLTNHEPLIKQVLELMSGRPGAATSLASRAEYQSARNRVDADAPLLAFINARSWDATIAAAPASSGQGAEQFAARMWRAIRCLSVSLRLTPQTELEAHVALESLEERPMLARWINRAATPTTALDWMPADCLAAVAGSIDLSSLAARAEPATSAETAARSPAGSDPSSAQETKEDRTLLVLRQLLSQAFGGMGPAAGGYATASEDDDHQLPLNLVAGIEIGGDQQAAEPSTPERRLESLRSLLLGAVSLVNLSQSEIARLETFRSDALELYCIAGLPNLPRGWLPSFTISSRTLLAGTSRAAIERSARLESDASLSSTRLPKLASGWTLKPDHALYIDLRGTRAWLSKNGSALLTLGSSDGVPDEAKSSARQRGLDQLLAALGLADTLFVAVDVEPASVDVKGVLHIEKPLKSAP
jgi:hypothetical protein